MRVVIAGAPVSFGVFELTPEGAETLSGDDVLSILAETGYSGVDLGPPGFLGRGEELCRRLDHHGLELAGGWIQLPFSDSEAFEASLPELDEALREFSTVAERGPSLLPLPTLADSGSPARAAAPGRGATVDQLSKSAWDTLVANVERAAARVRAAGLQPTFHHHAGTFVESPEEVDRLLGAVDVGLTLDTGHLVLGGGDPVAAAERWGDRINHLHLKDVDRGELARVVADGGGMREVWSSGSFVAFGEGDVDLVGVRDAMARHDFAGWLVIEQDVLNGPGVSLSDFRAQRTSDQRINRAAVEDWISG